MEACSAYLTRVLLVGVLSMQADLSNDLAGGKPLPLPRRDPCRDIFVVDEGGTAAISFLHLVLVLHQHGESAHERVAVLTNGAMP